MKVLGVILARGGSKGIYLKNVALCNGKPLLEYAIRAALDSGVIDDLYVSTDHEKIAEIAIHLGAEVIKRPHDLSGDKVWSRDALKSGVLDLERTKSRRWDIIAEIPTVNPLKTAEDIKNAVELMKEHYDWADSIASVSKLEDHHPMRAKKISEIKMLCQECDGCGEITQDRLMCKSCEGSGLAYKSKISLLLPFAELCSEKQDSRRQDLDPAWIRNGGVYVMTRETIVKRGDRFGQKCVPYIMPAERSVNIDTPMDLKFAEFLLKERGEQKPLPEKIVERYEKRPIPLKNNVRILCLAPFYMMPDLKEKLEKLGGVYYMYNVSKEDLLRLKNRFQYIVANPGASYRIDEKFINHFNKAKMILSPSTGLNHIDTEYAKERNIEVRGLSTDPDYLMNLLIHTILSMTTHERFITGSAEYTWAMMMALIRKIPLAIERGRSGIWRDYEDDLRSFELLGKSLGIIGLGRIGKNLARYAKSFGMKCYAFDFSEKAVYNIEIDWKKVIESDIVICSMALTPDTHHMIDYGWFAQMKPTSYFINTARGEIIVEDGLIRALDENLIRAAAVDVVDNERDIENNKLVEYAKRRPDKLWVTPHIAGLTIDSQKKAAIFVINEIEKDIKEE